MSTEVETNVLKAHVSINVTELDRSVNFYRKMFGIEPMKVRPGYAKFDVQNPPLNFSMTVGKPEGHGSVTHMGLQVASSEDVIAVRERWIAEGLKLRNEMQTSCCYAFQDKAWVSDPDGNHWEVFAVLANIESNAANPMCCTTSDQAGQTADSSLVSIENSCCK